MNTEVVRWRKTEQMDRKIDALRELTYIVIQNNRDTEKLRKEQTEKDNGIYVTQLKIHRQLYTARPKYIEIQRMT